MLPQFEKLALALASGFYDDLIIELSGGICPLEVMVKEKRSGIKCLGGIFKEQQISK
jgi:hypothetical protein